MGEGEGGIERDSGLENITRLSRKNSGEPCSGSTVSAGRVGLCARGRSGAAWNSKGSATPSGSSSPQL